MINHQFYQMYFFSCAPFIRVLRPFFRASSRERHIRGQCDNESSSTGNILALRADRVPITALRERTATAERSNGVQTTPTPKHVDKKILG